MRISDWSSDVCSSDLEVLLLGALLAGYGLASLLAIALARRGKETNMLSSIVGDFAGMPPLMTRPALAQFFRWSALFIMWITTPPIVARYHSRSPAPASAASHTPLNWVGGPFFLRRTL